MNHKISTGLVSLMVEISTLVLDPKNKRTHDDRNIEAIAASLRDYGQQKPIVVDAEGIILAGNGTLEAAKKIGWTHIAVARSDLVGKDAEKYAVADNRTAELAAWDQEALKSFLKELPAIEANALGFNEGDLAKMFNGPTSSGATTVPTCLQVIVDCKSEVDQRELFERLKGEGRKCKLLTL